VRTNWAGNVTFRAAAFAEPGSVSELRRLVAGSGQVRAVGTGHSFSPVADTTGVLVSLARLPRVIEVDAERLLVRVSAGLTYGELAGPLNAAGFALANLASLPHIGVAGACLTGTHGSGDSIGSLATAVAAIELVTAGGEVVTLDRSAAAFPGAVVSLGALGVVTAVTLRIEPAYQVRQFVYDGLPLGELDQAQLDGVFASGYSVSIFTPWREPLTGQVWRKERMSGAATTPPALAGLRPADGPRHPVPGISPESCTGQLGVPGPWHERLPHFRLDFTPSVGRELQSEYLLPRERATEAIQALRAVAGQVAPVLQISELRTVAADDLWLSPGYRRDTIGLHFTWIDDLDAVRPAMAAVERQLEPVEPRPHWGKLSLTSPASLGSRYQRRPDFRRLMTDYDPGGKFRNSFLTALAGA